MISSGSHNVPGYHLALAVSVVLILGHTVVIICMTQLDETHVIPSDTVQSRLFSIHPIHRINTAFSVKFVSLFFWQVPGNTCQRMLFWCCLPSARLFADAALLENFRLLDGRFKIRTLLLSATFTSKHHI